MWFEIYLKKIRRKVKKLDYKNRKIVVWGMGHTTELYQNAFTEMSVEPYAYTNSSPDVEGMYRDKPIIPYTILKDLDNVMVIISAKNMKNVNEITAKLVELNVDFINIEEFFFGLGADEIIKNIKTLEDKKSKKTYKSIIRKRINNIIDMRDEYEPEPYFALPEFRVDRDDEVFVDLGGYVGDTLETYIFKKMGFFEKAYIFEPDEKNYEALIKRVERLNKEWNYDESKIVPVKAGVGLNTETLVLKDNEGAGSMFCGSEGGTQCKVYALDDYFKEKRISYIKADIESFEINMLRGGVETIKNNRPLMAICIYHNSVDMFRIFTILRELKMGYRFVVRHHSCRDVDTVLYVY